MTKNLLCMALAMTVPVIIPAAHAGDPVIVVGEVRVNAQRNAGPVRANHVLTSVDILGADKVEDKNVSNSWELVGQLPGIQLTETRMGAESGKATFRAFNGEGYINGIKVLIDGIPSNVNSGNQRFIDMIFPLEVAYLEVVRGTNDPRYGLHNIGGNINVGTRQGGHYTDARLAYGSFASREVQLAVGREQHGFAQNYFLARQDSAGYRKHSDSKKTSLGAKWFMTSASRALTAGLVLRAYRHGADEPGFLTAEQLAEDRRQSPAKNANDRSDRDMAHASAHLEWQVSPRAFLSARLYHNKYKDDRRVTFTSNPLGTAPRQRRLWNEDQRGFLGELTWRAHDKVLIDGGVNAERQDNRYRRYRYTWSVPTDFGAPTTVQNNDSYTLDNVGAYLQAIVKPHDSLRIVPGWRADRFTGHTSLPGAAKARLQAYGWIGQPKLSMVYSPADTLSLYANWGRTFQILTGAGAPAYLVPGQDSFGASINTGREIGIKLKPAASVDLRLAIWRQDATGEVANMPATGTTVGLGQTRRQGIDFQALARPNDMWELSLSHSLQKAEVVAAFTDSGASLAGKEVFSTPRRISNLAASYRASDKWRLGLQGRAQGDYYIDSANTKGKFGGFVLVDASIRHTLSERASIDVQVRNVADRRYEYAWYDNFFWPAAAAQPMYSAGPGRSAYVALNLKM